MKKYVKFFISLLLLPLVAAMAYNSFLLIVNLGRRVTTDAVPFWIGLGTYFLFQAIFFMPVKAYVFGHELTHALAGMLSGAKLKSFKVSSTGGSVVLNKTSIWITLSPYFIPIYTLVIIMVYWIGCKFWPWHQYHSYFLFATGFSIAFHFGLTHYALSQGQSDLKESGVFFSGLVILIINCFIIAVLLKMLFPAEVNIKLYFYESWHKIIASYKFIYFGMKKIWTTS